MDSSVAVQYTIADDIVLELHLDGHLVQLQVSTDVNQDAENGSAHALHARDDHGYNSHSFWTDG